MTTEFSIHEPSIFDDFFPAQGPGLSLPAPILSPLSRLVLESIASWPETIQVRIQQNPKEMPGSLLYDENHFIEGITHILKDLADGLNKPEIGLIISEIEAPFSESFSKIRDLSPSITQDIGLLEKLGNLTSEHKQLTAETGLFSNLLSNSYDTDWSTMGLAVENSYDGGTFIAPGKAADIGISVSPFTIFDDSEGPIYICPGTKITGHSNLVGPLFIGPDCHIDSVILAKSSIGRGCRLGGEVSDSIFGDFSNKHHEGFVGHSLVGSWVNLGALTTTSDLKNNYGEITLDWQGICVPTELIKFGSIIGDFSKTAIGTMLNTGTSIGTGSNLFGITMPSSKYYPNFSWGTEDTYRAGRFFGDIQKIMARRNQKMDPATENRLKVLFKSLES